MGVYGGPNKVKGGIVFSLDGANPASYAGDVDGQTRPTTTITGTPYGYFGGGKEPSDVSTVDRIDYSNDTTTASTKGPLSSAKYTGGSTGNTSYGYWGGGGPSHGISTVDRVDYSSDTGTAAVKGPLNRSTYLNAATGNASYGYFGADVPGSTE